MNLNYNYAKEYIDRIFEERIPVRTHNPDIIEYASKTIIATGTYRGLKFDHGRAPYLTRPMWCLSPASPYNEIAMMFPAQSGKTFTANTTAMYYIECVPSEILYATSDETMAIKWLEREIVPRAAASGIQFRSEVESKQSRRTGNTSYSKTFPGGNIDIASALSPAQLASATKRVVLGDEVDRWKIKLGEQGSVISQLRARTQAWKNQAKIFWFSTPTTEDASVIFQLYQQGDQELYYVPCPYCGTMQLMDFIQGRGYGLTWEKKSGHIYKKSIELICENKACGRGIKESSKPRMLKGGEWRAQVIPEYEHMVSFNLNGLYSFQLSWYDMVVAYEEAQKDQIKKQDFDQLKMGRPHKRTGKRVKAEKIIENMGNYKSGQVPEGVLFLTAGIDVQEGTPGSETNPPRLEMEILGIGAGYRTWSIEYKVFKGDISDPYGGAWELLNEYAISNGFTYFRKEDGFGFPVSMVFIDSGDGSMTYVVYAFAQRWQNTFPIKGRKNIIKKKTDKVNTIDEEFQGNMQRFRQSRISDDILLYLINTNYYKTQIYSNLAVGRQEVEPQRPGFCSFPNDYNSRYFEMLTSEERLKDGSFDNGGRRNESLDCRVYALCAGDVYLSALVDDLRLYYKGQGAKPQDLLKINTRFIIDDMAVKTAVRKQVKK